MRTLADKTQFIVITHRRGTMEAADVLYGVTMQEQGVSQDFDHQSERYGEGIGDSIVSLLPQRLWSTEDAPPIFFLRHQKENAPCTVEKKKCQG